MNPTDAKNEVTETIRQMIGHQLPFVCETNRAETFLSTLSFQSTVYPERHVWIDTNLDGIGIDLEDWNNQSEWDNAVARITVDSLDEVVEIVKIWLSGGFLDNYSNVNQEYQRVVKKLAPSL